MDAFVFHYMWIIGLFNQPDLILETFLMQRGGV